jgi:hypothetical protein
MVLVGFTPVLQSEIAKRSIDASLRERSLLAVVATESILTIFLLLWAANRKNRQS